MRRVRRFTLTLSITLLVTLSLAACSARTTVPSDDAGADTGAAISHDASTNDAAPQDATSPDASTNDGSVASAGGSDFCGGSDAPDLVFPDPSHLGIRNVDTTSLHDSPIAVACAPIQPSGGNDGFFALDVMAGDYIHLHVQPTVPGRDPVLSLFPAGCAASTCPLISVDRCRESELETLRHRFTTGGRYYVAVDDAIAGGGTYVLTGSRPTCGNGIVEYGETCDSAIATAPGAPSCDASCRNVLVGATTDEVEPNDDVFTANGATFTTTAQRIEAVLGGCDADVFSFSVVAGEQVVVHERPTSGATCRPADPNLAIRVVDDTGASIGTVTVGAGDSCLGFEHTFAAAQRAYVVVEYAGTRTTDQLAYALELSHL